MNIALQSACPAEGSEFTSARSLHQSLDSQISTAKHRLLSLRWLRALCVSALPFGRFCLSFVFTTLRIAFCATPVFSQPSALPPGVPQSFISPLQKIPASVTSSVLAVTCRLFFSLYALFRQPSLCFQSFADSFQKTPGGVPVGQPFLAVPRRSPSIFLFNPARTDNFGHIPLASRGSRPASGPPERVCAMLLPVISSEPSLTVRFP